jgi:hypothetical protein
VSDGRFMNMFPTDLHGSFHNDYYVTSLRIEGKACAQVGATGKIVLSEVPPVSNKKVYALGKNHMKELSSKETFDISSASSQTYKFPLPKDVMGYRELEIVTHLDVGIHRIFLFRAKNRVSLQEGSSLSHIHSYYAQWKKNNSGIVEVVPRSE